MEYLFKKDQMLKLLADAPSGDDTVVISINFKHGDAKGVFLAEIKATTTAIAGGAVAKAGETDAIEGCPNPPGC